MLGNNERSLGKKTSLMTRSNRGGVAWQLGIVNGGFVPVRRVRGDVFPKTEESGVA